MQPWARSKSATIAILFTALLATLGWARQSVDAKPAPVPSGVWDLRGTADSGASWMGTLVLTRDGERIVGHVDWLSDRGQSGREYLAGVYDARTRALTMQGTRLEFADGVVRCTYRCELSRDGMTLSEGRWTERDPAIPGSWSATRMRIVE